MADRILVPRGPKERFFGGARPGPEIPIVFWNLNVLHGFEKEAHCSEVISPLIPAVDRGKEVRKSENINLQRGF